MQVVLKCDYLGYTKEQLAFSTVTQKIQPKTESQTTGPVGIIVTNENPKC